MPKLGVNIDHVATLRELRHTKYPEPILAAQLCELAGADGITVHLREDRRHIQDRDVKLLKETIQTRLNLEMAVTNEMVSIASDIRPHSACFVPEKREEKTTEGGLDVVGYERKIADAIKKLNDRGIQVSLFIEPDQKQIEISKTVGAQMIEIHTGRYCEMASSSPGLTGGSQRELERILSAISHAKSLGLICNAGHGLDYVNILPLAKHLDIYEFNIGHSIISRAVMVGLDRAVREMKELLSGHPEAVGRRIS